MSVGLSRLSFKIDTSELLQGEIALNALGNSLDKLARKRKSLEMPKFRKNATRKIKGMVLALAMNVASYMSENTPIGDEKRINSPGKYRQMYEARYDKYRLPMQAGYHAGAYRFSESNIPEFKQGAAITEYKDMLSVVQKEFMSNYTIGDVFYIGAKGPAYKFFEQGAFDSAPDGVIKPTLQQVMATYKFDMQMAYARKYS